MAFIGLHKGFSPLGFNEVQAQFGRHHSSALLVRFPDALGEGGDAALLEILVHEGIYNGIIKAVEEPDGLNDGDDHVNRDSVIFVLEVIWRKRQNS